MRRAVDCRFLEHGKRREHTATTDLAPADIAEAMRLVPHGAFARSAAEMHEADRLFGTAAERPGDAGDGDREVGAGPRERAFHHGSRHRLAHRAMALNQLAR